MKKMSIKSLIAAMLLSPLALVSCGGGGSNNPEPPPVINVTGITLNKTTLTVGVGQTETLVASLQPSNAVCGIVWKSSSMAAIAKREEVPPSSTGRATIFGNAPGTVTITATTELNGGPTAECTVTVPSGWSSGSAGAYVAGYSLVEDSSGQFASVLVPTVWKNGRRQPMDFTNRSTATSVFVSGNDVYSLVAGNSLPFSNPFGALVVYKNDKEIHRISEQGYSFISPSFFVSGNDVYIAVTCRKYETGTGYSTYYPRLFKNGQAQSLGGDENSLGEAYSVFVSNGIAYVWGGTGSVHGNVIWENGVRKPIPPCEKLFVSGTDVYSITMDGSDADGFYPIIWKNGAIFKKCIGAGLIQTITSMFVSGGDVYFVGESDLGATLWKNDEQPKRLGDGKWKPQSVYVSGTDVHVAGYETISPVQGVTTGAVLWINGTIHSLDNGKGAAAYSVFVVK